MGILLRAHRMFCVAPNPCLLSLCVKIALVILHADPARGGAERYTLDLAAGLTRRGYDVSLLASTFAGVPEGVAKVEVQSSGATRTRRYVRFLDSLDQHLARQSYDIGHAMLPVR